MARERIDQLIDRFDPVLRQAFSQSIAELRDRAQVEALARMIEVGDVEGAIRAVGLDPTAFRAFDQAIARTYEAAGDATAKAVPETYDDDGLRVVPQFDVRNPVAEAWLRTHSSQKITEIVEDQRLMIRGVLEAGMKQGLNPRTAALDLVGRIGPGGERQGGYVGLTSSQAEWVRNYAAELASNSPLDALRRTLRDRRFDGTVRRAAESGQPIPADVRDKMVTAYKNRALRYRAETIARTEAMAAVHGAQEQAIEQALDKGGIDPAAVAYVWRTAGDKRVRDSHRAMDGQVARRGEAFTTGSGAKLRYPGDPSGPPGEVINCRCWREPKIDFLRGVR